MTQIIDFVTMYAAWIIGGIVLISLAVVGYFADKTNFGQGKKTNFNDATSDVALESGMQPNFISNNTLDIDNEKNSVDKQDNLQDTSNVDNVQEYIVPENLAPVEEMNEGLMQNQDQVVEQQPELVENFEKIDYQNENSLLIDENFNKFNEEFDSILPKKEIINDDLLNDIDELELGKTQKIDPLNVPNLGDIELPKIKPLVEQEQDIWKF